MPTVKIEVKTSCGPLPIAGRTYIFTRSAQDFEYIQKNPSDFALLPTMVKRRRYCAAKVRKSTKNLF